MDPGRLRRILRGMAHFPTQAAIVIGAVVVAVLGLGTWGIVAVLKQCLEVDGDSDTATPMPSYRHFALPEAAVTSSRAKQ